MASDRISSSVERDLGPIAVRVETVENARASYSWACAVNKSFDKEAADERYHLREVVVTDENAREMWLLLRWGAVEPCRLELRLHAAQVRDSLESLVYITPAALFSDQ